MDRFILCSASVFILLSVIVSVIPFEAHGDGWSNENVYASIGDRKMAMFIKINPPIITSENLTDRYVQFRFYDANTNSSIKNVSFFLNVTKGDQKLGHDLFYTKDGFMTIKFQPGGKEGEWIVYGERFPINDAWYSQTGQVNVASPILSQGGLYHFNMDLLSFDYPNENLPPYNGSLMFDSYLSVGDFSSSEISYNTRPYNATIVSYYDKVSDVNFDPTKLQISWSMPFYWDPYRYQDRPFLVHEELRIPDSFGEFVKNPTFSATVNGNPIRPDKIVLDPYSIPGSTILHLFVNKDDVQRLSQMVGQNASTMDFAVSPSHTNVTTSTDIFSDFGGWQIKLGWSPQTLSGGEINNLKLAFYDQLTGQRVQSDVNYDLKIFDANGGVIISKSNLVAKGGTDIQSIDMPSNGIYVIKVSVTSFINNDILDKSRPGTARGNVVIPEFGTIVTWVLAVALISIIVASSRSGLRFTSKIS